MNATSQTPSQNQTTLQTNKVQKYTYYFAYAVGVITHKLQQMTKFNGE